MDAVKVRCSFVRLPPVPRLAHTPGDLFQRMLATGDLHVALGPEDWEKIISHISVAVKTDKDAWIKWVPALEGGVLSFGTRNAFRSSQFSSKENVGRKTGF
jgi:hypothetical protein